MDTVRQEQFERWGVGYSGCDGGDLGTPECPSIWVCGIEWGGGHTAETLRDDIISGAIKPSEGYASWDHNLKFHFNRNKMKLLAVVNGRPVSDYKDFAEHTRPFTQGSLGYFKANLYPIGFKTTNHAYWKKEFVNITGFVSKQQYLDWCMKKRFPAMRRWAAEAKPKLILCAGKTYLKHFAQAFADPNSIFNKERIDDRDLYWTRNSDGSLVVVFPFMSGRWGLVRNDTIQGFGKRIRALLA